MIEKRKELQVNTVPEMADKHLDLRLGPEIEWNEQIRLLSISLYQLCQACTVHINCFTFHGVSGVTNFYLLLKLSFPIFP